ncbi:MAG: ABC transporter permease subunit [Acidimicrobiia bacterium]|nr:ABC transporter permease subunit [Acidimicrobiia bacterium]MYG59905.1 ABC transporter permease subunit [Acidimicrobiia bacterium]MYJ32640.1 ABC transporter permease subunit [Acidimicrobiia bacterium]
MTNVTEARRQANGLRTASDSRLARFILAIGTILVLVLVFRLFTNFSVFPDSWDVGLADPIDRARRWLIKNQTSHWLYTVYLNPITDAIDWGIRRLESILKWFPWFSYPLFTGVGLWWTRGRVAGALGLASVTLIGVIDLWEESFATLALMGVSVLIAMVIGIPLGIAAWRSDAVARMVRPTLDAMQTMPGFVYLIPFVLLFGFGRVPAMISTVIFALAPVVRLTEVGLRTVPQVTVEASEMFGATERQTLRLVRLPQARPAIYAGMNQTTMLAMSMVVIAAFIGAGGLGQVVLRAMQSINVGKASEAGIAIVIMAIVLDRFSTGIATADPGRDAQLIRWLASGTSVIAIIGGIIGWNEFPESLNWQFAPYINDATDWARDNLYDIGGSGIGTGPFSDFVTLEFVTPLRELLSADIPWPAMIGIGFVLGLWARGLRLAIGIGAALFAIGFLGMWALSMDTLAQTIVAVVATLAIGVPVGILTSHNDLLRAALKPVLDFFQTIPSFVLLVPVITLFHVGRIPGIIASVIYALPAAVHYTDLGLRRVPGEVHEAAESFGATRSQRLRRVEMPLAAPELMVAVNQVIMLILAMVVIAGLVGGGGLGLEAVRGLRRSDAVGRGFEAGIAIVLLASILDRLTRAIADRLRPPAAV